MKKYYYIVSLLVFLATFTFLSNCNKASGVIEYPVRMSNASDNTPDPLPVFDGRIKKTCVVIPEQLSKLHITLSKNYKTCPASLTCTYSCWDGNQCTGNNVFGSGLQLPVSLSTTNCNLMAIGMATTQISTICVQNTGNGSLTVSCAPN